ncbi:hypothetical protein SAMN04488062_1303 [Flavobacterium omnivorum]|uniref:Uncharacterized protein n=1 Tax=Flavobacterium omnivorum TaxID=178355 RepID=A0A1G8IXG6_9FLAO|nr:hypothetical protein SAMN04488062_1303 [Flavobacterium omnivorum]
MVTVVPSISIISILMGSTLAGCNKRIRTRPNAIPLETCNLDCLRVFKPFPLSIIIHSKILLSSISKEFLNFRNGCDSSKA